MAINCSSSSFLTHAIFFVTDTLFGEFFWLWTMCSIFSMNSYIAKEVHLLALEKQLDSLWNDSLTTKHRNFSINKQAGSAHWGYMIFTYSPSDQSSRRSSHSKYLQYWICLKKLASYICMVSLNSQNDDDCWMVWAGLTGYSGYTSTNWWLWFTIGLTRDMLRFIAIFQPISHIKQVS